MSDPCWTIAVIVSQIVALLVWGASTFGLAVAILFWMGRFRYVPWR